MESKRTNESAADQENAAGARHSRISNLPSESRLSEPRSSSRLSEQTRMVANWLHLAVRCRFNIMTRAPNRATWRALRAAKRFASERELARRSRSSQSGDLPRTLRAKQTAPQRLATAPDQRGRHQGAVRHKCPARRRRDQEAQPRSRSASLSCTSKLMLRRFVASSSRVGDCNAPRRRSYAFLLSLPAIESTALRESGGRCSGEF